MIKNIILFFFIIGYFLPSFAGFWGGLSNCITDPCNCGISDKTRKEKWDGQVLNKGKKNSLCPPWNKDGGRHDNTCLIKKDFPGAYIGYYENLCGEESPASSYHKPKIRVRGQQCNAVSCWTTENTLNWDGECVTLAGGYVYPLHRICARVAMPADPIRNTPVDPGYTRGKHLNFEGATKDDKRIKTHDGEVIILEPPKLCI